LTINIDRIIIASMSNEGTRKPNKRNIPVPRLQEKFIELCWKWMGQNRADKLRFSKYVSLPHSRISELLLGTRVLTMYYVGVFVRKGVMSVAEIYDNDPKSPEEREAWEILKQNEDTDLQRNMLLALDPNGTLTREAAIQFFKTHQRKNSNIVKVEPKE